MSRETVTIRDEYITLGQFLKLAGVVDTGGQVKALLAEATILVNGEADNRRGRKLYPGDTVQVDDLPTISIEGQPPIELEEGE
jgi:S4 domain protein YaaA